MSASRKCVQEEWKKLPIYQHPQQAPDLYQTALKNLDKNRYSDILAFESTRVKLRDSKEYINANYVDMQDCSFQYIATEAPMISSLDTFWKMIWEQNVKVIVMLTKILEGRKVKASCYWPTEGKTECFDHNNIQVTLHSVKEENCLITRNLSISRDNETREIVHIQYTGWPDYGVPTETATIIKLTELLYNFEKENQKHKKQSIVVHCSAGIGRCGTLLAILAAKLQQENQSCVSIPKIVSSLRNCRSGMVQTKEQYYFIYSVLSALTGRSHSFDSSTTFPISSFDLRMSHPNVPIY